MPARIGIGIVLLIAASICGLQGCARAGKRAGTIAYEPTRQQAQHQVAVLGVHAERIPVVSGGSLLDQAQVRTNEQTLAASSRSWVCDARQEETNQKNIAYFQTQLQIARLHKAEILAVNTTSNMDAVFTLLGAQLFGEGYKISYYRCNHSFAPFAVVYNEYTTVFNDVYKARVPILFRIADTAENDLRELTAAKDRLMAALASGPGPATTQARIEYRRAVAKLREYRLQDFYVDAKLAGGQARSFKAADFWSRANAAMYQDAGDDYLGYTIEEILGSPSEANLTITTSNSIATIEVRHMSYGPGFCTVETRSSLGGGNVAAAPPLVYGPWHTLETHAGVITLKISTEAKCDTGARSQVRYFK